MKKRIKQLWNRIKRVYELSSQHCMFFSDGNTWCCVIFKGGYWTGFREAAMFTGKEGKDDGERWDIELQYISPDLFTRLRQGYRIIPIEQD